MNLKDRLGFGEQEEETIKIKLGKTYRDKILGAEGIAIAQCRYISGCDHVELAWRKDDETKSEWVDILRLEEVKKEVKKPIPKGSMTGGPASHPPQHGRS